MSKTSQRQDICLWSGVSGFESLGGSQNPGIALFPAAGSLGLPPDIQAPLPEALLLISKDKSFAKSLVRGPCPVSSPGESIAELSVAQVDDLPCWVEGFRESFDFRIVLSETLLIAEYAAVVAPDSGAQSLMYIVDFAFPWLLAGANRFLEKV